MTLSQNGWSAVDSASTLLYTWTVPGGKEGDSRLRLRRGSGGFLLVHAAVWFDARIEDIQDNYRDGELDDWAYAYRPIRGYSTVSNHASGTAMDLNATEHPLGVNNTFTEHEELLIHRRLRFYNGCIRWGGDYNSRKDEMHFELDRNLADCEVRARQLLNSPIGKRILKANPSQRAVILS